MGQQQNGRKGGGMKSGGGGQGWEEREGKPNKLTG